MRQFTIASSVAKKVNTALQDCRGLLGSIDTRHSIGNVNVLPLGMHDGQGRVGGLK